MFLENTKDISTNLTLLQFWLGLAACSGCLLGGTLTIAKSRSFFVSKRFLLQASQFGACKISLDLPFAGNMCLLLNMILFQLSPCSACILSVGSMVTSCVLGSMDSSLAATSTALRSSATALSRPRSSRVPGVLYKLVSLCQV